MSKLNILNVKNNPNIRYIKFTNDKNNPIPIRNSFEGCTNLERIYGNIEIYSSGTLSTFNKLSNFSIFGTLENEWRGFNKVKNSIV